MRQRQIRWYYRIVFGLIALFIGWSFNRLILPNVIGSNILVPIILFLIGFFAVDIFPRISSSLRKDTNFEKTSNISQVISGISILFSALFFFLIAIPNQKLEAESKAWQILLSTKEQVLREEDRGVDKLERSLVASRSSVPALTKKEKYTSDYGRIQVLESLTSNCKYQEKHTLSIGFAWNFLVRGSCVQLSYLNLSGVYLAYVNLEQASLQNIIFNKANLFGANLSKTNLNEANLIGSDLRYANLEGADLRNAYLEDADLRGADLRGVQITNAKLQGAKYGKTKKEDKSGKEVCIGTQLPTTVFNPKSEGMVQLDDTDCKS